MPHGWTKDYNHAERLLWQDANKILTEIGLQPGSILIDIGAGDGFFSLPAARIVGDSGTIYALDLSDEAVASLKEQAAASGLHNICAMLANAEISVICEQYADIVLLANVLHDFDSPLKVLANARKMLKPGGILADLDWKIEPSQQHGPPLQKRLSQDKATSLFNQAGFEVINNSPSGPFHYLLLAKAT